MSTFDSVSSGSLPSQNIPETGDEEELALSVQQFVRRDLPAVGSTYGEYDSNFAVLSSCVTSSGEQVFATDQFVLMNISENRAYRNVPIYTFGKPLLFSPDVANVRVFEYTGVILNNQLDGDVRNQQWQNWNRYLSLTQAVIGKNPESINPEESPLIMNLTFRNMIRTGYLLNFRTNVDANLPTQSTFGFSMFITSESFA